MTVVWGNLERLHGVTPEGFPENAKYREIAKYGETTGEGFSTNGEGFSKNGEGFSDDPEYFTKMNLHHLSSKITKITEKNFVIICLIK